MKSFLRGLQTKRDCDLCGNDKSYLNFINYSINKKSETCYCYKCVGKENLLDTKNLKVFELRYMVRLANSIGDILYDYYLQDSEKLIKNPMIFFIENVIKKQKEISIKFISENVFNIKINDSSTDSYLTIDIKTNNFKNLNKIILGNILWKKFKNNTTINNNKNSNKNNNKNSNKNSNKNIEIYREILDLSNNVMGYLIKNNNNIIFLEIGKVFEVINNKSLKVINAKLGTNEKGQLRFIGNKNNILQQYLCKELITDKETGKIKESLSHLGVHNKVYVIGNKAYTGLNSNKHKDFNNKINIEIDLGGSFEFNHGYLEIDLKTFEIKYINLKLKLKLNSQFNSRYNRNFIVNSGTLYHIKDNIFSVPMRQNNFYFDVIFDIVNHTVLLDKCSYFGKVDGKELYNKLNTLYLFEDNKFLKLFDLNYNYSDFENKLDIINSIKISDNTYLVVVSSEMTLKNDYEFEVYKDSIYLMDFKNKTCKFIYTDDNYSKFNDTKENLKIDKNIIYLDNKVIGKLS